MTFIKTYLYRYQKFIIIELLLKSLYLREVSTLSTTKEVVTSVLSLNRYSILYAIALINT